MVDSPVQGPYGTGLRLSVPDVPRASETVTYWLLTAPTYHPIWSQYVLACVRLRDNIPRMPKPKRQFLGATHEILVVALDPEQGPYDEAKMAGYERTGGLPFLTPVNVAHQFIATDEEMYELVGLLAWSVVQGVLNPETGDAPERVRMDWLTTATKTIAHMRGELHAP